MNNFKYKIPFYALSSLLVFSRLFLFWPVIISLVTLGLFFLLLAFLPVFTGTTETAHLFLRFIHNLRSITSMGWDWYFLLVSIGVVVDVTGVLCRSMKNFTKLVFWAGWHLSSPGAERSEYSAKKQQKL
ncbi:hypothetical protein [Cronobacter sakazakii]|uniref:hypothetical protein n=1 Tax=Cronobacter sakazakii TaxID=28141 RepID=UPI003D800439